MNKDISRMELKNLRSRFKKLINLTNFKSAVGPIKVEYSVEDIRLDLNINDLFLFVHEITPLGKHHDLTLDALNTLDYEIVGEYLEVHPPQEMKKLITDLKKLKLDIAKYEKKNKLKLNSIKNDIENLPLDECGCCGHHL